MQKFNDDNISIADVIVAMIIALIAKGIFDASLVQSYEAVNFANTLGQVLVFCIIGFAASLIARAIKSNYKKMTFIIVTIAIGCISTLGQNGYGLSSKSTYEDCVLQGLKTAQTPAAVYTLKQMCRAKYPE